MIYLDHAATTPVPRAVADAMYAVLAEQFGNPSAQYPLGLEMKHQVAAWRRTVAQAAGCEYFARYTDDVAPNGTQLQRLAIVGTNADIIARAQAMLVPVDTVTALLIGPASSGDAMTLWGMAQAAGAEYFARYTD